MAAQGWCPSTHRLHAAADGWLARVKVPGGILGLDQVAAVAEAAERLGSGVVEITNRANLQVRGLRAQDGSALRHVLGPVGLSAPTAAVEDRRNVLASPAAGLDPTELVDVRPVVTAIVAALDALPAADGLPHKFGVVVDGGGQPTVRGRALDVGLGAIVVRKDRRKDPRKDPRKDARDRVVFELVLGDALPLGSRSGTPRPITRGADHVLGVAVEQAGAVVAWAASLCAAPPIPAQPGRMVDVVEALGLTRTVHELAHRAAVEIERIPIGATAPAPARDTATTDYREVAPAHGRLSPSTLRTLVHELRATGTSEVRLTPWRTILVPESVATDRPVLAEARR